MNTRRLLSLLVLLGTGLGGGGPVWGQGFQLGQPVHYELIEESSLVEDCYPCGPPVLLRTMRGSFELVLIEETPMASRFEIRGLRFHAGPETDPREVQGGGTLEIGGEVALRQTVRLAVEVNGRPMILTNESPLVQRPWPMVAFTALETPAEVFYLRLTVAAAPLRELWFTTVHGMTPGLPIPGVERLGPGDLLAHGGRLVRSGNRLTRSLELEPTPSAVSLDALTLLPGGEVCFSLAEGAVSKTLGNLQEGDWLSETGRRVMVNQDLTRGFGIMPPVGDLGLDAWQERPDGTVLFSIREGAFSEAQGVWLGPGDILSSAGTVYRRQADLLARFEPEDPAADAGLDAIFEWPSGEIWFSTETRWSSRVWGPLGDGDVLSDAGYVVWRNLELVAPYQPLEDLADFGLDSLWVVSDLVTAAKGPTVGRPIPLSGLPGWHIPWSGPGRVFQVERAAAPQGPYAPASPIMPDLGWNDLEATLGSPSGFYRVRQW